MCGIQTDLGCFIDSHQVIRYQARQHLDIKRRNHDSHFLRAATTTDLRSLISWPLGWLLYHVRSKHEPGQELRFDHHANKKAWMNSALSFKWLMRCDKNVAKTEGRKVLHLIDNWSTHGNAKSIPQLQNDCVEILPHNATSHVQPLDAGIIAWVKATYKRRLLLRLFDNIDMRRKFFYNVVVLSAMWWIDMEWKAYLHEVIVNWLHHYLKRDKSLKNAERGGDNDATLNIMEKMQLIMVLQLVDPSLNDYFMCLERRM